ncbi:BspA family leucine-rich repeat surface protein [Flavobacterium laiguense]|uniref:PKD domain-containing protein n=1 Tax=Flavobacterium laiguense TaxID=2169409 RepID=A0A2U1JKF3_9FLAO|nr:BspA family leucine-rich repeat surface protein [Flavobacterium laiguense]PWA05474.1 hypothetical protein DB891_17035 [Flavobacterium laiguense]
MGSLIQNAIWGRQKTKPFVSTWKTDNISTGSSTATQVKLPLLSSGTYNFVVDWGDSSTSSITIWNQAAVTHTYSVAGTYTITIKGVCTGWQFNNTGDRLKFLSVSQWGSFKLGINLSNYFYGCNNLNLSGVTDILDLTEVLTLRNMFRGCTALTTVGRINEWNMSSINDLFGMFNGATAFNQPLNSFLTPSVTTIAFMFAGTAFNQDIGGWNTYNITDTQSMFSGATAFNNGGSASIGSWTTSAVTNMSSMFSQATNFNQPIGSWTTSAVTNMSSMFQSATAFNQPIGSWNVSKVQNLSQTFKGCSAFNQNINTWDTSLVTNMFGTFNDCWLFNQPLNLWNTTNVTNMAQMFYVAKVFNQNVGNFNMSKVTLIDSMFQSAVAFNNGGSPDINNWNINTTITGTFSMYQMFMSCALFNQNIGAWNVSKVTNTSNMFQLATNFNNGGSSDINNWNTSSVTNMSGMLQSTKFNQPLNLWNTSNVTSFYLMFSSASVFNQNIGAWNVSKAVNFSSMFLQSSAFNNGGSSDINNWQLSTIGTINMESMFYSAASFNQPINSWNTSVVTNMHYMFYNTAVFNQNIGSWNISNVTGLLNFMGNKTPVTFSTVNLDAIYNGWSSRPVKTPITTVFGTAKYTAASSAGRAILTGAPNNWMITDGGI